MKRTPPFSLNLKITEQDLDEDVFQHPEQMMARLNLEYVGAKYKRKAPYYSDELMLKDVNQFNEMYEQLSMKIIGKVL